MTYSIKNFAQTVTYTVNDSTANTNAVSLTLLGKSLPNYGTYFNQNFVWLMENFSSDSANPPPYAVQGQLWWDNTYKFMNVYDGSTWKTIYGNLANLNVNSTITTSNLTATNISGLITTNAQPYITSFGTLSSLSVSGTISAPTFGNAGATFSGASGTLTGTLNANIYTANSVYAGTIGNTSANLVGTITTNSQPYITTIGNLTANLGVGGNYHNWGSNVLSVVGSTPAITLGSSGIVDAYMYSTATKIIIGSRGILGGRPIEIQPAVGIGNGLPTFSFTTGSDLEAIAGGEFLGYHTGAIGANTANTGRFTTVTTTSGGQVIGYLNGAIGANTANTGAFTTITSTSHVTPTGNNTANLGAVSTLYANVHGTNYYVANSIIPIANVTVDIGSAQRTFDAVYANTFYGTSTTAQYADLAEKYLPDADYEIGTVMMVGGNAEVTQHDGRKVRAIGVISAYPAYKMNDGQAGGVYVALKGRVPVKVVGPVKKGQALIGTSHGLAVAQSDDSQWMFGISLEDHLDHSIKLIESVIL